MTNWCTSEGNKKIPNDALSYNGHYYKIYDEGMIWNDAKNFCESLGGHLVTITSENENDFIKSLIKNGNRGSYWIGGYKNQNNNWNWVTGESFNYANWAKGEPNGAFNGQENKIMLFKIPDPKNPQAKFGEWNDILQNCGEGEYPANVYGKDAFGLICEWDS